MANEQDSSKKPSSFVVLFDSSDPGFGTDIEIVPDSELVRFLAVFDRAFTMIHRFGMEHDVEGMWLGTWLARDLHNVPFMLVGGTEYSPADLDSRLMNFPNFIREFGVSDKIVTESARITTSENTGLDLGLTSPDLDVCVAPNRVFAEYAYVLYIACLFMRNRKYNALEEGWTQEDSDHGIANAATAHALAPIPKALVQWSKFDEREFRENLDNSVEEVTSDQEKRGLRLALKCIDFYVSTAR